jgi:large subunit ribosomal protein L25
MKSVSISGSPRANVGKKDAKALRGSKLVPCVLYGGKEQVHFSVNETEFKQLIYTPDVHTVDLSIADKKFNAILQEVQFHKITDSLLHVDFLELVPNKPVVMNIPVRTKGVSPGVRNGGKLVQKLKTIKAKGLIENMPDEIPVNIDKLEIGDGVRVSDIHVDGLTFLNAPNVTIVGVQITRAVAAEASAAAAAPAAKGAAPAPAAKTATPAAKAPAAKAPAAKK